MADSRGFDGGRSPTSRSVSDGNLGKVSNPFFCTAKKEKTKRKSNSGKTYFLKLLLAFYQRLLAEQGKKADSRGFDGGRSPTSLSVAKATSAKRILTTLANVVKNNIARSHGENLFSEMTPEILFRILGEMQATEV